MDIEMRGSGFTYMPKLSSRELCVGHFAWANRSEESGGGIEFLVAASINLADSWCWLFCVAVFQLVNGKCMIPDIWKYPEMD